jgi:hypothetical protein
MHVESRLKIIQTRCHEIASDLFEGCREILTRPEMTPTPTREVIAELRNRSEELRSKASKLPAGECGPVFKDAGLMARGASRLEQLNGKLREHAIEQLPPEERDMTPEEEYDDFRRILAKKLGCEDDNTIILETIGDLQRHDDAEEAASLLERFLANIAYLPGQVLCINGSEECVVMAHAFLRGKYDVHIIRCSECRTPGAMEYEEEPSSERAYEVLPENWESVDNDIYLCPRCVKNRG